MDPNVALAEIAEALRRGDPLWRIIEQAGDLKNWLARGGFEPTNKEEHNEAWRFMLDW